MSKKTHTKKYLVRKATKEVIRARRLGYTDEQILEALRTGGPEHILYAEFIEREVLKPGIAGHCYGIGHSKKSPIER